MEGLFSKKGVSRRWFIGGAASFGAFGGCRFFAAIPRNCFGKPGRPLKTAALI